MMHPPAGTVTGAQAGGAGEAVAGATGVGSGVDGAAAGSGAAGSAGVDAAPC